MRLKKMQEEQGELLSPNDKGFGDLDPEQGRVMMAQFIRRTGLMSANPKTRKMNPEVYAGIIERIENWFSWRDDHWGLDKVELLKRVEEWNVALERYCKDMGIDGEEKIQVYKLHEASPYAPCANLSCCNIETKVKGFAKCAQCRTVAYSSHGCQTLEDR